MSCCCVWFESGDYKTEDDREMGQSMWSNKDKPEKDTQRKEELEDAGGDAHAKSAMNYGISVKDVDSSPDVLKEGEGKEEEGEKVGVETACLAIQHNGMKVNLESKECDSGLQIKPSPSALSNIGPSLDTPTSYSDSRESPSPPPADRPMPPHLIAQVSKHSPTHLSVSGGGAALGSGSDQQLVSSMEPQTDNSDSHQWWSDGAPSPTSPGEDGGHAHKPDALSDKATAEEKEEEGGSHAQDVEPPQGCDSGEGRTAEPTGPAQVKEDAGWLRSPPHATAVHTCSLEAAAVVSGLAQSPSTLSPSHTRHGACSGPEPTPTNGSDVHSEPQTGAAPDTGSLGVGMGEGLDSHKQQQGEAASRGRWPGTAQRGTSCSLHDTACSVCSSASYCGQWGVKEQS